MYTLKHIYKNFVRKFLASKAVGMLIWLYIWFVFLTSSKKVLYPQTINLSELNINGVIYAFWHNRLMLMHMLPKAARNINILISEHADGKIIGTVSQFFGQKVIWGSSKRGWARALKQIFIALRTGESLAITPDGPKGPANEINSNIIKIASKSGLLITPTAYGIKKKRILSSWDRFILPLPFTKLSFVYGEPIKVARNVKQQHWTD